MIMITRSDVDKYLATLDKGTADLYKVAQDQAQTINDTLTEEFQIACKIVDVFWSRVEQFVEGKQ